MKKRFLALFLSLVLTTAPSLVALADEPVAVEDQNNPVDETVPKDDASGEDTSEEKTPEKAPEESTPEEGTPEEGTPEEGTPEEGTPEEGTPEEGTPEETPELPSDEDPEEEKTLDYQYELQEDNTICITRYTGYYNDQTDLCIPDTIDDYPVTKIGSRAFAHLQKMNSIDIPASVKVIGEYAFYASQMHYLYLHEGLESIETAAFNTCDSIRDCIIPKSVTYIGTGALPMAGYTLELTEPHHFCYEMKSDNTVKITGTPFGHVATDIVIPAYISGHKVTEIGERAFNYYSRLDSVVVPHTVKEIGPRAFKGSVLEVIELNEGLKIIGEEAFFACNNLEYIYVPDSVTQIGDLAFGIESISSLDGYLQYIDPFALGVVEGSVAEKYAEEYGLDCYIFDPCDHTGDRVLIGEQDPSCGYNGYTGDICCYECGAVITEGSKIPATGDHHFIDNICQICGKPEKLGTPVIKSVTNGLKSVVVQWEAVEGADNYRIYRRKEDVTSWSYVGDSRTLRFDDTKAASGTTYYYTVRCYDLDVMKPQGGYDKTGKGVFCLKAGTPSSLSNTSSGITVKWAKITGAEGYYVYRKSGSDSYKRIGEVKGGSNVSYTDTTVKDNNGTAYTYTIRAYHGKTLGNYAGKTLTRLTGVTLSTLSNPSTKAMKVTWKKQSKVSGYEIQYSTSSTFASGNKSVKVSGAGTLSKTIKSLTKGKTYYVRIRGYKTAGSRTDYSAWSAKKSIKIKK